MITVSPPEEFDAVALARSTDAAPKVLWPWCQLHNSYVPFHTPIRKFSYALYSSDLPFASAISAQARIYVNAINFSVVAVQLGFTIAEEAISLRDLIPVSTPNQHQSHLTGMLELARDGHNNATKALQMFRNVRRDVLAVCCLFFCRPLVLNCSGQLLRGVEPGHEEVEFKFSIHVNGQSMSKVCPSLCIYTAILTAYSDPGDKSFPNITQ